MIDFRVIAENRAIETSRTAPENKMRNGLAFESMSQFLCRLCYKKLNLLLIAIEVNYENEDTK